MEPHKSLPDLFSIRAFRKLFPLFFDAEAGRRPQKGISGKILRNKKQF